MRQALTRLGMEAERAPEAGDDLPGSKVGTALMAINSVCGWAAGRARPGITLALKHTMAPDAVATVCVGGNLETTVCREGLQDDPSSSPSAARYSIVGTAGN
jgi:putative YphP/YqiW family bacilliredoxin